MPSTSHADDARLCSPRAAGLTLGLALLCLAPGCATIRVTDPPRSATEQFLLSTAAAQAVDQLSAQGLRDRAVWIDSGYFNAPEQAYVLAELRSKLLLNGVRLMDDKAKAQIIVEVRSGGVGIDRREYLLGLPTLPLPGFSPTGQGTTGALLSTPELAILKNTRQRGFASVAFVAYWAATGEVVFSSGPYIGRSLRDDYWILGTGPRTVGNIPPTEQTAALREAQKKRSPAGPPAPPTPPPATPPASPATLPAEAG